MRHLKLLILFLLSSNIYAQPNTEVYLLDINENDGKISFSNLRNISNNEGYDNQPSFYDDNTVLYSSTRNGQTDIAKYDIPSRKISWLTNTPGGSEYSPLRIPGSNDFSAIRLDTNGLQRLYGYDATNGKSKELLKDLKVGYHVWHNDHLIVSSVLVENRMDLVISNLKEDTNYVVEKNVGRSLHKIPNSDLISYLTKKQGKPGVKSLNPFSRETKEIIPIIPKIQDMNWLQNGSILVPDGKLMAAYRPEVDSDWSVIHHFEEAHINEVSRMVVSPNGKHLAIVSEESPANIVQKQVDSYNAGNLDDFVNCYSEDVVVRNFPADTLYVGHEKMRKNYSGLSPDNMVYKVEVVKRIIIGNKVIDQEKVTQNGKFQQMQVALYEVYNGAISSMTFIFDDKAATNPEAIVKKQLDVYNDRDIEGFLDTYTEDVKVFNFPSELQYEGTAKMREGYAGFFETTPDLNCEIKNRITIANKVIDEEYITANGNNFGAVAIYEVENGKIAKVTFLR